MGIAAGLVSAVGAQTRLPPRGDEATRRIEYVTQKGRGSIKSDHLTIERIDVLDQKNLPAAVGDVARAGRQRLGEFLRLLFGKTAVFRQQIGATLRGAGQAVAAMVRAAKQDVV